MVDANASLIVLIPLTNAVLVLLLFIQYNEQGGGRVLDLGGAIQLTASFMIIIFALVASWVYVTRNFRPLHFV